MTGGPDWLARERFDVNAKPPPSEVPLAQMRLMAQALLVERFKLRVHHETRELPIYRLVWRAATAARTATAAHGD